LDPFGLLASGALLIAVAPEGCDAVCHAVRAEEIDATCVGDLASGAGDAIIDSRSLNPLPRFERDELARFLESLDGGIAERADAPGRLVRRD